VHVTPDGIELMFAVHHVNQALLFFPLRPHLLPTARVFIVASGIHDDKYQPTVASILHYSSRPSRTLLLARNTKIGQEGRTLRRF